MKLPWLLYAATALGCGSKQDGPSSATGDVDKPTRQACTVYAQRTAELMYVGFDRGAHGMAQYIKPEFLKAIATPLVPYCIEHLPVDHVRCIGAASTATDADRCALDSTIQTQLRAVLQQVTKDAIAATNLPATEVECRDGATASITAMQSALAQHQGGKLPSRDQLAALCVADHWTADFVRCTAAGKGSECKAKANVEPGVQKLLRDVQSTH